jgi:hypothetical protein
LGPHDSTFEPPSEDTVGGVGGPHTATGGLRGPPWHAKKVTHHIGGPRGEGSGPGRRWKLFVNGALANGPAAL